MPLTADVFRVKPAPKNVFRSISKKLCFRGPFDRQHGKWVETQLQSERKHLYNIF